MDNKNERLPLVDIEGNIIGSESRGVCHDGKSFLLHPVVHLHLFDSSDRLLLQKRSSRKTVQPGKWDTAVGGHVDFGEDIPSALRREVWEEIGLDIKQCRDLRMIDRYVFSSPVEKELIHCFVATCPVDFVPVISEPEDIEVLEFWDIETLKQNLEYDGEAFTPNFRDEFINIVLPGYQEGKM